MASVDRQNRLIVAEDWKKIYQSFRNADFQSYDFDNLRRTMITYLRENYPEDFNDYIESSEYLALIDLIAYLGQNLAFRFDLNSRDNFLELAERRESVLRLARLLSYNPKRSLPGNGLLKFTAVSTTEAVTDSNGRNLAGQTIVWNDPANANWYEQFIKVINAAMTETIQFGKPQDRAVISGIKTEQYRFNATNTEVPVYAFTKAVDGRNTNFEVVSCSFKNSDRIYEEAPFPGNSLAFLYRDDGGGAPSSNTGFFAHFRQGSLQSGTFAVNRPSPNETVDIDSPNINNDDVWLYKLDSIGFENELWTKVDATEGNNVIYNSINKNIRNIYSVLTRTGDRIRLNFADGVFGDLPQGNFKIYYRTSNGLRYTINPNSIKNVTIDVPYLSKRSKQETLTITLSLKYTVNNATAAESSASIKQKAPQTYYTQGRMITGEDYNILPLSVSQEIIKTKAVNRVSSGISRYFDLKDTSGKYSSTNIFGTDGIIYKQDFLETFTFTANSRSEIESIVVNNVAPLLKKHALYDFYLDKFPRIGLSITFADWRQITSATNLSTGFVKNIETDEPRTVGSFTSSNLSYLVPNSLVKFTAYASGEPVKHFDKNNAIVDGPSAAPGDKDYIWSKVINVVGDGTYGQDQILPNGEGPVKLNEVVPTNAVMDTIIPKFSKAIDSATSARMIDLIFANKEFGLRFDVVSSSWKIITESNLDKLSNFNLGKQGDISNQQLDSSWLIMFETDGETYTVTSRGLRYVFESKSEVRFFFDSSDKVYDTRTGTIIRDKITVLSVNKQPDSINAFMNDFDWNIIEEYKGADGYIDSKKISISFSDTDEDGIVDDPDLFTHIVNPSTNSTEKYIFQQRRVGLDGVIDYYYVDNSNNFISVYETQGTADLDIPSLTNGKLVYIINEDLIKTFNAVTSGFVINTEYRAYQGRNSLKFQYIHAADESSRLDPSATNIVDVYMLTRSYDTDYRRWLRGELSIKPLPPSSDALFVNFGSNLNKIKTVSDEIIYHPVKYKNIFGSTADASLQAVFKVVKSQGVSVSDSDVKTAVINAINEFFAIENWEFGDTFYFGELSTYVMNKLSPNLANIVLVPKQEGLSFGSLYEIKSNSDELFVSSATVEDVEIISEITAARIRASGTVLTSTQGTNGITSV